jgi:DHA1 family purine ribonucleoside efflux pump-like MFS transporter
MSNACSECADSAVLPEAAASAQWWAVFSLTLGVFGLVTAEFLPASLLTSMAADLAISEGAAGQSVTATALVAAVSAPLLPLLTRRFDRRYVMFALTLLLLASNALAVAAQTLTTLLVARVVLGVALGGFWAMAAPLAMRLVPEALFPRAMSLILSGVSVATVCAAPVGAWMGANWGWRSAFMAAGVVALLTLLAQIATLPSLRPRGSSDLRVLGELLGRRSIRIVLLVVLLVISGHFAGFTYIRPLMENVTHLSIGAISGILLGYGIGGFFGNLFGGWLAGRSERVAVLFGSTLIALLAASLLMRGESPLVAAVAITLWGFAFGAFPVGLQIWMVRAAPDQAEGASGLLVAAFQVAIASGAIGGGVLVDQFGALGGPLFAVIAMVLGAMLTWHRGPRVGQMPVGEAA